MSSWQVAPLLDAAVDMENDESAGSRIKAFAFLIQRNEDWVEKGEWCSICPFTFMPIIVDSRNRTNVWVWCIKDESAMSEVLSANGHRDCEMPAAAIGKAKRRANTLSVKERMVAQMLREKYE